MAQSEAPAHDADFFHSCSSTVICPAEGSGEPITIRTAREDHHYRGGNMDGGVENIVRRGNTVHCNHCNRCIS